MDRTSGGIPSDVRIVVELYTSAYHYEKYMEEKTWSGGRDSNPQQVAWKATALPIELPPQTSWSG